MPRMDLQIISLPIAISSINQFRSYQDQCLIQWPRGGSELRCYG